ncbi:intraflagellar transport protein 140 homolog [Ciona intestinalis]
MALYFDCILESSPGSVVKCLAWHEQHAALAVCTSLVEDDSGAVNLYDKQGVKESKTPLMHRSTPPTTAAWHPTRKLLAVGWENGEVLVWNDQEKELHEIPSLHMKPLSTITWSSNGSRLATGDKEGVFAVWKADARGRVQHNPLCRHDLGASVVDCVVKQGIFFAFAYLARAAVSGDETALDMFADMKKSANRINSRPTRTEGVTFYVGLSNGGIHYIDEKGLNNECLKLDSPIQQLLFNKEKDFLVAISTDLQVIKMKVMSDGSTEEMESVKFSGQEGKAKLAWAGGHLLAVATSDQSVRLWDLVNGDNFALLLDENMGFEKGESINNVSYLPGKGVLSAGTSGGRIAMWNSVAIGKDSKVEAEDRWKLQSAISLEIPCNILKWCPNHPVLAVGGGEGALLLTEQKMKWCLSSTMVAIQSGPRSVAVDFIGRKPEKESTLIGLGLSPQHLKQPLNRPSGHIEFETTIPYNGIAAASEHIAVWNGKQVSMYEITSSAGVFKGSFECESSINALHDQSLFSVEQPKDPKDRPKIQVRNFQGTVKQLLSMQENEGGVDMMSVNGNFIVVGTSTGCIKIYDLTRREAKAHNNTKQMRDLFQDFGSFNQMSVNCVGSKVAFTYKHENGVPDFRVFVYDCERDRLEFFDFSTGTNENDDFENDSGPKTDIEQSKADAAAEIAGRYPISVHWDATESRLLSCEARITDAARNEIIEADRKSAMSILSSESSINRPLPAEVLVVSLFSTQDHGLLLQDFYARKAQYDQLIGLRVPNFYFSKSTSVLVSAAEDKSSEYVSDQSSILRQTMRDFVGLDESDEASQAAMLNFSYYLTIGDMDEAFKSIKLIKGAAVWESMAKMCVKTRRLDVAKVCLANMGHARGARAMREAEKEPELDARVARLALELGMNDEAERLYKNCQRHDLLNVFYQSTAQWGKALETAELSDRIHLRTTFYKYAKHLEACGDIAGAIPNFEKSGTQYFEVPRMLFDETEMLEAYIMKTKDRKLRKWWAQYMESTGEMDTALKFYQQAADPLSLVRVFCYCGNPEKAAEVANETGDRAACYHLARQFENNDDIKQAIHFFTRAMAYGNAIRICKEHGFEDQLMNLALLSTPNDMIEAARHYEERPDTLDKAVMLYHKAGHFSRALELAFESKQFGALELISQDLDDSADPVLLERCAEFFTEHGQHERAVSMLVVVKKYAEAISICSNNDVRLNEELVEKLTVPKDYMDQHQRERLLAKLASCCMNQGEYHLACKKYTQAGDKEKAMRALLKSGDTEKIIFFAGVSRLRNLYVMAANYLQSLDWRKDPEIMKNIISFYTKGRALDSLAGFYDACAQVEIDEYQNYEKAMGALTEAFKCLTKAKMANKQQQEIKITELKARIALVKKFIQTRRLFDSDPQEGIKQCHALINEPDLESSVRYGDVYGLLIEYCASQDNNDKAYHYMQELRSRLPTVTLSYFVNMKTIETVHRAVGVPLGRGVGIGNGDADKMKGNEDSEDEVTEELYDGGGFGYR